MIPYYTEADARKVLDEKNSLQLARETFELIARKKVFMPPKMYLVLTAANDFRAMPAFLETGPKPGEGACGIKWISVFPQNAAKGQPTVNGTILLSSTDTGTLLAILEANVITAMRTAATAVLAASCMARPKPKVLALVGAGIQAAYQLRAHAGFFQFDEIRVWGFLPQEAENFCRQETAFKNLKPCADIRSCVENADIVVTCTSSRKPLVQPEWIAPGTHINAIGADAKGKEELDPRILLKARVVVDEWEQASHSGEINVPISEGSFTRQNVYAELSEVVSGQKQGRLSPDEITVFDSTGLAALDIHFSRHVYDRLQASR